MEHLKPFAQELAEAAAAEILPHFGKATLSVDDKADDSPVTVADRGAEAAMRKLINQRYPQHGIIGEEYGNENEDADFVWVLDPIDGTKSFISGVPLFGTLIGLLYQGQPVLGVINQPVLKQFCIGDNELTTCNGERIQVRENPLDRAVLLTSDYRDTSEHPKAVGYAHMLKQVRYPRTWGDCYGYLLLTTGNADIMIDPILEPWDLLPLIALVRGAGGVITDWAGDDPVGKREAVAAAPALHEEVVKILNA